VRTQYAHIVDMAPTVLDVLGIDPPVTPDYPSPYRFTGTLHKVTVDVSGELITDTDSEIRLAMARQ
jgi:arylsulfatase A-like enzyme